MRFKKFLEMISINKADISPQAGAPQQPTIPHEFEMFVREELPKIIDNKMKKAIHDESEMAFRRRDYSKLTQGVRFPMNSPDMIARGMTQTGFTDWLSNYAQSCLSGKFAR